MIFRRKDLDGRRRRVVEGLAVVKGKIQRARRTEHVLIG